jgi:hypothetical protein
MEFPLDEREDAKQNVPVDVIEKIQRCQQPEHEQRTRSALHLLFPSLVVVPTRGTGPTSLDHRANAATWTENSTDDCPFWFRGAHYILKDAIDYVLLKNAEIAVAREIFLQRFQFQTALSRHVTNREHPEIR